MLKDVGIKIFFGTTFKKLITVLKFSNALSALKHLAKNSMFTNTLKMSTRKILNALFLLKRFARTGIFGSILKMSMKKPPMHNADCPPQQ
jgi:hypothetical protein